ncbi:DsbA family oxidoreductase [Gordonia McavH-238-E]|uniref:DsbA family oxidoreductase n=1 Tax=Gordonia sp. McavH-238-E TaxID=2917736 RepID=UPI001EF4A825|nr:DsbA family oxidoreductase [Gordonia sp. McavH-238-E]MCG7634644.1 DsbA family oxidoreductase [Gordonia sp. McavH-238-E]
MSAPITVDIWSDIACPWCYIGKRKFEAGLAEFAGRDDVEVTYHSFELAPDTPVDFDGSEVDFLVRHKGMPAQQVEGMLEQVTGIAAEVGLDYDFDSLQHTMTLKAHEALHFAKERGRQLDLVERLFKAYFEEGRHVGRPDELADLAADIGLDRDEVIAALDSGAYAPAVAADIDQARAYGISGVPFFVINGKYGVSGAQAPEIFTQALDKVRAEAGDRV